MKKVQSFSKLVELVRTNDVYLSVYDLVEQPAKSRIFFYSKISIIGSSLIGDICNFCRVYDNLGYYCTFKKNKLALCVYIKYV